MSSDHKNDPEHPDPKGKMRSHAPGHTTGADGEDVELSEQEPAAEPAPAAEPPKAE